MARTKRQPWEIEGTSKSTYYRRKRAAKAARLRRIAALTRMPPAPSMSPGDRARQRIASTQPPSVIERTRAQAKAEQRGRGAEREVVTVDVDQRLGEAVDAARVCEALAQLEHMLRHAAAREGAGGSTVVAMHGTVNSFAACARALRKAGYA